MRPDLKSRYDTWMEIRVYLVRLRGFSLRRKIIFTFCCLHAKRYCMGSHFDVVPWSQKSGLLLVFLIRTSLLHLFYHANQDKTYCSWYMMLLDIFLPWYLVLRINHLNMKLSVARTEDGKIKFHKYKRLYSNSRRNSASFFP